MEEPSDCGTSKTAPTPPLHELHSNLRRVPGKFPRVALLILLVEVSHILSG